MLTLTIAAVLALTQVAPMQLRGAHFTVSVRVINSCHLGLAELSSDHAIASSNSELAPGRRVGCSHETPIMVNLSLVEPGRPAPARGGYNMRDPDSAPRLISAAVLGVSSDRSNGNSEIIRVGRGYVESNRVAALLAELAERTARTRPDAVVMATILY